MSSLTLPRQKVKLLKAVERAFTHSGWNVDRRSNDLIDFRVDCGPLNFLVKCVDETRACYEDPAKSVAYLERLTHEMRGLRNRQMMAVLDRNFLRQPLDRLIDRAVVAVTVDQLPVVVGLADFRTRCPGAASEQQAYLLERCLEYGMFVSDRHRKDGDVEGAIRWARHAVDHSSGYTSAYPWLFKILKEARQFEAAAEVGYRIQSFRPDDPALLRGMEDLARRRGDSADAARWRERMTARPTTPRTLEDMLAKQNVAAKAKAKAEAEAEAGSPIAPDAKQRAGMSGLGRILRRLRS